MITPKMTLSERDRKCLWHPFTQERTAPLPIAIERAAGSYLYDEKGAAYLDLISSWWVTLHGHGHPEIAKAIYDQACQLEHVIFARFTHEPAVSLCEKLQALLPSQLSRFFFSDNGSTAVEVALKMAYQYWSNKGFHEKTLFLSFEGGYHGETFGSMSVGVSEFHRPFSKLCFPTRNIPFPDTWEGDEDVEEKETHALNVLEGLLKTNESKISALILEPLVQGVGGMRMCRPEFLKKVVERVRAVDVLVIFDEVMTGFGRTGTHFALEQAKVAPDFLCLSKGLTGGFLPLALTVTTEDVYEAFLSDHFTMAFAHGHSYTANPLGCAAAIASLDLLTKQETQTSIQAINQAHKAGVAYLLERCPHVVRPRVLGTIAAFDVASPHKSPHGTHEEPILRKRFLEENLLLRPLGDTIYLLPPYSVTTSELEGAYERIAEILRFT